MVDATDSGVEDVKALLPQRLFATDRFSSERTNIYSTADFLPRIRGALKRNPEMLMLLSPCFVHVQHILKYMWTINQCTCAYECSCDHYNEKDSCAYVDNKPVYMLSTY